MTRTAPARFATVLAELSDPLRMEDEHTRNDHNPFALATLADCYSPDSSDSPGARFLAGIARDVAERVQYHANEDGTVDPVTITRLQEDDAHEIADGAVPIYTHDRWATFVDLGAYNEDATELGATADDLTGAAGVALYMIAERLVRALAEELSEALDEDSEDEDDTPPELAVIVDPRTGQPRPYAEQDRIGRSLTED